jgi:putative protein-disulfide isomerase
MMKATLIYVHDPMCSWCWGFEPVKEQLFKALLNKLDILSLVGGLAPDSDSAMPKELQVTLQNTWKKIEQTIPGIEFNYQFWQKCSPRRSTYPSNRAVLAAREQGEEFAQLMTNKIQRAYYLEARNPSDIKTLVEIAEEIELDMALFLSAIKSESTQQRLLKEIEYTRSLGVSSFPSLLLKTKAGHHPIHLSYTNADAMLNQIARLISD